MCAAALCASLAGATSAHATKNYCVGTDATGACPVGATAVGSISSLLSDLASAGDPTRNNVYLTSGDYSTAAGLDFGTKPVKLFGVGDTRPSITASALAPGAAVLTMNSSTTDVTNVDIVIPASTGAIGILAPWGGQKITGVSVTGPSSTGATGISVSLSTPQISGATIDLPGTASIGVFADGTTSALVDDVKVIHAGTAVQLSQALTFKVRRLVSHARLGVEAADSDGAVSSSLIAPSSDLAEQAGTTAVSASSSTTTHVIRVDNCTLIGAGTPSTGLFASAAALATQQLVVNSTIVSGFANASGSSGAGTKSVELAYSVYTSALGPGTTADVNSHLNTGDLGFKAAGDFHLVLNSPLVDAGDPAALDSNDSATDADGEPRVVSRGAGNIRDIGAYEVQNSAPVPDIKIVTAVPSTTSATEFSAAGSTDAEGDAMSYDWKFDGAPSSGGVTAKKLFVTDGPHSVQLTVTDKTGSAATASTQFNVARGYLPIKLRSQNARLSTKGTFKLTMTCPAEAISDCRGRLLFKTAKKVDAKNYTERPGWTAKAEYLAAARYVFSIKPGTTQKLEVRTYSTFQNILWKRKKFKLQSQLVFGTTDNANLTANRATFTVKAPKSRK